MLKPFSKRMNLSEKRAVSMSALQHLSQQEKRDQWSVSKRLKLFENRSTNEKEAD
jgi:hypothetical protein